LAVFAGVAEPRVGGGALSPPQAAKCFRTSYENAKRKENYFKTTKGKRKLKLILNNSFKIYVN
jgi:hypothetical protein